VENRAAIVLGALAGAMAGAVCGYLYLTEEGQRLRADIEPRIGELAREIGKAREAATRAREAAAEGWQSVRHVDATLRDRFPEAAPFGRG
jgi:hypothetical protein